MAINKEFDPNQKEAHTDNEHRGQPGSVENKTSVLTDKKDNVELKSDDNRPVLNSTQEGYGMDDGPNQPLSKEMLHDLQDAGQRDLQNQREEEKGKKKERS